MIERRAAGRTLLRWKVLQPHVASRDYDAEHRNEGDRSAVEARAGAARGMVEGSGEKRDSDRKKQQPLDDAKRAGLESNDELKVIAEGEHPRAGEKPDKVADTSGKEEPDHGDRA